MTREELNQALIDDIYENSSICKKFMYVTWCKVCPYYLKFNEACFNHLKYLHYTSLSINEVNEIFNKNLIEAIKDYRISK